MISKNVIRNLGNHCHVEASRRRFWVCDRRGSSSAGLKSVAVVTSTTLGWVLKIATDKDSCFVCVGCGPGHPLSHFNATVVHVLANSNYVSKTKNTRYISVENFKNNQVSLGTEWRLRDILLCALILMSSLLLIF